MRELNPSMYSVNRSSITRSYVNTIPYPCVHNDGGTVGEKPTIEEMLRYAEAQIKYYIRKYSRDLPDEQKEEITQECMLRLTVAYEKIDVEMGWKSFVQKHCYGAVTDYVDRGKGFEESKWAHKSKKQNNPIGLRFREEGAADENGEPISLDDLIAKQSQTENSEDDDCDVKIKWDLLARLCKHDHDLHLFVRYHLMGNTMVELTTHFGLTRERIGQRIEKFVESLDSPDLVGNPWTNQILFALGICSQMGMPDIDQNVGWHFEPVDFSQLKKPFKNGQNQMSLFGSE